MYTRTQLSSSHLTCLNFIEKKISKARHESILLHACMQDQVSPFSTENKCSLLSFPFLFPLYSAFKYMIINIEALIFPLYSETAQITWSRFQPSQKKQYTDSGTLRVIKQKILPIPNLIIKITIHD